MIHWGRRSASEFFEEFLERSRKRSSSLLVEPGGGVGGVIAQLLGLEPQGDLVVGRLDGVGAVADVAADLEQYEMFVKFVAKYGHDIAGKYHAVQIHHFFE